MSNVPPKVDAVVGSPCKTRGSKSSASSVDEKGIYDLAYKMMCQQFLIFLIRFQRESSILIGIFSPTVEQHFNETYELHQLLGQGGFAVVYSGTRVRDGLPVSAVFLFLVIISARGSQCLQAADRALDPPDGLQIMVSPDAMV